MNVQCPYCFEQVPVRVEAVRITQARRCPRGRSAREHPAASLKHCYCRPDPMNGNTICCKCGDPLRTKI